MFQWSSILKSSFMPLIRSRGEKYFKDKKVNIQKFSITEVEAVVHGTIDYFTALQINNGKRIGVGVACTCPFFRQGYPCKHIWATALAADKEIYEKDIDDAGLSRKFNGIDGGLKERKKKEEEKKKTDLWKEIISKDVWKAGERDVKSPDIREPGQFMLAYKIRLSTRDIMFTAHEIYIRKDGTQGREKKLSSNILDHPGLKEDDRIILSILRAAGESADYNSWYGYSGTEGFEDIIVSRENMALLLPRLAESGRCRVVYENFDVKGDILHPGKPFDYEIKLKVEEDATAEDIVVYTVLEAHDGGDEINLDDIIMLNSDPVFFLKDNNLYRLKGPDSKWVEKILKSGMFHVRKKELKDFVKQTEDLFETTGAVELPEKLAPPVTMVKPSPVMVVSISDGKISGWLHMDYDGLEIDPTDPRDKILDHKKWRHYVRDHEEEQRYRTVVEDAGFEEISPWGFSTDIKQAVDILPILDENGISVEAVDKKKISSGRPSRFNITSGIDWFDLDGGIDFNGEIVPLARVVRAFLQGRKVITLGNGDMGIIPEDWLKKNLSALDMGKSVKTEKKGGEKLRFHSSQALLLDSMLEEVEHVSPDRKFLEVRDKIKNFTGIKSKEPPKGFKGSLRGYQKDSLGWFDFLKELGFGGILADDMGLGKTVQVLAMLAGRRVMNREKYRPSMVVAPTSLVFNWLLEIEKFVPDIKALSYTGLNRKESFKTFDSHDLILTTYGVVRRDIKELSEFDFDYIILDESQAIKNNSSQISKAVRLLKGRHKLCLTGTPLENHLGEFWSQMEFLNPGLLGSWNAFNRRFIKPVASGDKKAMETIKNLVMPFMLRRTKETVAKELPDKVENIVRCEMSPAQAKVYMGIKEHYRSEIMSQVEINGMNKSKMRVLEGLLRLRQAANHPALVGHNSAESGKMNELFTLVKESVFGGHKALVFSQFTSMLRLIRVKLDEQKISYEYLDGRTPAKKRQEKVESFQYNEKIKLFLISLKAGGVGLNLTAADYVFLVDPWWNPAVELQAVDRTHRIGQTHKVFTYKLITSGTIEEKVLELQEKKQDVVNSIMSGSRDIMKNLTAADLELLFS